MSNSLFSLRNFILFYCDPARASLVLPDLHEHHFWSPNHSPASYFSAFSANLHVSDWWALHQQQPPAAQEHLYSLLLPLFSTSLYYKTSQEQNIIGPEEDPMLPQGRSFPWVLAAITIKGVILLSEIKLGEETQLQ